MYLNITSCIQTNSVKARPLYSTISLCKSSFNRYILKSNSKCAQQTQHKANTNSITQPFISESIQKILCLLN